MPYVNDNYGNSNGYKDLFKLIQEPEFAKKRAQAVEDAKSQDLYIMDPMETNLDEIGKQWDNYMSMTKPFRRRADWITLEYLGLNNQQIYEFIYNKANGYILFGNEPEEHGNVGTSYDNLYLVKEDSELTYIPPNNEVPTYEEFMNSIPDIDIKVQMAVEYQFKTGYIILKPGMYATVDDLERDYYAFQSMIHRHREMSNWMCMELFGMTNDQLYICLRKRDSAYTDNGDSIFVSEMGEVRKYYKAVIENDDITMHELENGLLRFKYMLCEGYDKIVGDRLVSDMEKYYAGLYSNVPSANWEYSDLPAFTPDEMIDMGVYPNVDPEGQTGSDDVLTSKSFNERWFEEYKVFYQTGIETDSYREANLERIHRLQTLYNMHNHNGVWHDAVLKYGWNPIAEFSAVNRTINDGFMREHYEKMVNHYDIVDISREPVSPYYESGFDSDGTLHPVFIVLSSGTSGFSELIKGITKSPFSHAMLSLDPSLHHCYSFGMDLKVKKTGSFIIEDVPKKFKNELIRVYTVFVSSKVFETIKKNVDWFIQNQKKTIYGWRNLISYLFQIPWERDNALICSQFVDRMLKLGHIDFTKKSSSLIAPADLDRMANRSKKIYQVYKDIAGKWNPDKISKKIKSIGSRDKTYKWEMEILPYYYPTGYRVVNEVKDIPIQINKSGDVLVRAIKKIDYDAEFAKSHKLLMEYDKQNNTEAMKVELAKLWSYMLEIEEKLYGGKSISASKRKDLFKVRALIIGDFKKYMEVVQRSERNFDFGTYYEKSPYSNSSYRISGSTIHGLLKLVKDVL